MMKFQQFFVVIICLNYLSAQEVLINILQINEDTNDIADRAVQSAIDYANNDTELEVIVNLERYVANNSIPQNVFINGFCQVYDSMIQLGNAPEVIIDTTKAGGLSENFRSFIKRLYNPTIVSSYGQRLKTLREGSRKFTLQMKPPADTIPNVINRIVTHLDLPNAVVLYEPNLFFMNNKLKKLLKNTNTRHVFAELRTQSRRKRALELENYRNLQDMNNFFILGSPENISTFLESVPQKFFNRKFAWFAITISDGDLAPKLTNASFLYLRPHPSEHNPLLTIEESECPISYAFYFDLTLRTILSIRQAMVAGDWNFTALTCKEFDGTNAPDLSLDLVQYFLDANQTFTYSPFVLEKQTNKSVYGLKGHMSFSMSVRRIEFTNGRVTDNVTVGIWESGQNGELKIEDEKKFVSIKPDKVLRVVSVPQPPFIMADPTAPSGFRGLCVDLMDLIIKHENVTYELEIVTNGRYGRVNDSGEWNGIIRHLIDKTADVALGALSVTAERESVIDFTVPYYDLVGFQIMMQVLRPPDTIFKFLTVLDSGAWLCMLGIYLFASCLMWVFARLGNPQQSGNEPENADEGRNFTLAECLWFCMTSLTPQGGGDAPRNLSGRLVAATWWLYGFIIIASYTANLAAFLTIKRIEKNVIESLDDLTMQYEVEYAPEEGSHAQEFFQRMMGIEKQFYEIWEDIVLNKSQISAFERTMLAVWDYPITDRYTKLYKAMEDAGFPATVGDAVARVKRSQTGAQFAYIGDASSIRYLEMTNCDLQAIGPEFSRKPYAIAVQKGSPWKDSFDRRILDLLNQRELERLKMKWWTKSESLNCPDPEERTEGIALKNIGGVFLVVLVGVALGLVMLIFEYFHYRLKELPKIINFDIPRISRRPSDFNDASRNSVWSNISEWRIRFRSKSLSRDFKY